MAGNSTSEALETFREPLQRALSCIVNGTVVGSGHAVNVDHTVTLYTEGPGEGEFARLRTPHSAGEPLFQFAHQYRVVPYSDEAGVPRNLQRGPYKASTSYYRYDILDRDGHEVVVFHWEPASRSPVRTPHMHLPAAEPITLPQREGSAVVQTKTYLNKFHFPTGHTRVEDVVELLIREFKVDPLRDDWEAVLQANREAIRY